jgi:delta 1-pyrroline-5-carboxylate dehydrogenase
MSDHFDKHLARLKAEKGKEWAFQFEDELKYFKLCHLMGMAREVSGLSIEVVSKQTGVPKRVISKIEKEEPGVSVPIFEALTSFFTGVLAKKKTANSTVNTNRLGALVASLSPADEQFCEQP